MQYYTSTQSSSMSPALNVVQLQVTTHYRLYKWIRFRDVHVVRRNYTMLDAEDMELDHAWNLVPNFFNLISVHQFLFSRKLSLAYMYKCSTSIPTHYVSKYITWYCSHVILFAQCCWLTSCAHCHHTFYMISFSTQFAKVVQLCKSSSIWKRLKIIQQWTSLSKQFNHIVEGIKLSVIALISHLEHIPHWSGGNYTLQTIGKCPFLSLPCKQAVPILLLKLSFVNYSTHSL